MGSKKTLLLIDGSQVLMFLTQKILERVDYSVYCARGGAEALELLLDITPDAILLEKELSDGDGIAFCRELRKRSRVPIMLLSGDKEDELPALQAGANDFLRKPYDHDVLIARIGVLMDKGAYIFRIAGDQTGDRSAAQSETLNPPAQQQPVRPNSVIQPASSIKKPIVKRLYIAAAACILFVLIFAAAFKLLGNSPDYTDIPDEQPPLTGFPFPIDEDARPYAEPNYRVGTPVIAGVTVAAGTVDFNIFLRNPADNSSYITFEIALSEGESLYTSGLVKPGMYIENITLSRGLEKGKYNAVLITRSYSADNFAEVSVTETAFYITAE